MSKTKLVCSECKGNNIQIKTWVDANTKKCTTDDGDEIDDNWCEDCEEHVDFDTVKI